MKYITVGFKGITVWYCPYAFKELCPTPRVVAIKLKDSTPVLDSE
ncbi:hypothetical protein [Arenibacter sp. P308M17]|nr:hypothetical protein [Arenibacter sp. P308M17]